MLGSASHDSCIDSVIKKESLFELDYYQESSHGLLSILNEVRGNESVNFEKTFQYSKAIHFSTSLATSADEQKFK